MGAPQVDLTVRRGLIRLRNELRNLLCNPRDVMIGINRNPLSRIAPEFPSAASDDLAITPAEFFTHEVRRVDHGK